MCDVHRLAGDLEHDPNPGITSLNFTLPDMGNS